MNRKAFDKAIDKVPSQAAHVLDEVRQQLYDVICMDERATLKDKYAFTFRIGVTLTPMGAEASVSSKVAFGLNMNMESVPETVSSTEDMFARNASITVQ